MLRYAPLGVPVLKKSIMLFLRTPAKSPSIRKSPRTTKAAPLNLLPETMRVLGLTGGIGMGKSTSAHLLRSRSIPVVDTDDLARQVVEPGQPALAQVQSAFGQNIIAPDGTLRRDDLARLVFADPSARRTLEDILHPPIRQLWRAQIETWRAEGRTVAVVVIPLLFETHAEQE